MVEARLDKMDRQILAILETSGRIPIVDLAEKVGLSPTPCAVRIKRMEADGIITGYTVKIDREKAGLPIMAIVLIRLNENTTDSGVDFSKAANSSNAIQHCFKTLGRIDYILHIHAKDLKNLEEILREEVASLPHILSSESILVIEKIHDQI